MTSADQRFVSFHEAGHAIAMVRFGYSGVSVRLGSYGGSDGAVSVPALGPGWTLEDEFEVADPLRAPDHVTALFTGFAAEVTAGSSPWAARHGARDDLAAARLYRPKLGPAGSLRACFDRAFAFVREPRNWRAIEAVAARLATSSRLSPAELASAVASADR